jgi:Tfp pilus assembly protein PilV
MRRNSKLRLQTGAALLEAIVALAAVVVALAGIAVVVTASVSNSQFIQDQNQANKYAQEGIEYIKSYKEQSYADFLSNFSSAGALCLGEASSGFPTSTEADCGTTRIGNNKFIRRVQVTTLSNCASSGQPGHQVIVTVNWQSSKCDVTTNSFCHTSELQTCVAPPPDSTL